MAESQGMSLAGGPKDAAGDDVEAFTGARNMRLGTDLPFPFSSLSQHSLKSRTAYRPASSSKWRSRVTILALSKRRVTEPGIATTMPPPIAVGNAAGITGRRAGAESAVKHLCRLIALVGFACALQGCGRPGDYCELTAKGADGCDSKVCLMLNCRSGDGRTWSTNACAGDVCSSSGCQFGEQCVHGTTSTAAFCVPSDTCQ